MRRLIILTAAAALLSLFCTSAYCHKIRVFAYGEGDTIVGEASFSGGKKAKETAITVTDQSTGKQLLTTKTDSEGKFSFTIPEVARQKQMNMLIIAEAGEGHRNEWLLEAADYIPGAENSPSSAVSQNDEPEETDSPSAAPPAVSISEETIRRIVDESVAKQLSPIKRTLAEIKERKPKIQDILGGLGYIIGLTGIAAYMKSQKGATHDS